MVHESHEWLYSIYGHVEEDLPSDTPLGKLVQTSLFFDTNLYHDLVTGCTMTSILHLIKQL